MEKRLNWLTGLLVLQVILALALHAGQWSTGGDAEAVPLLELDTETVDGLVLSGPDEETVNLVRTGEGWRIPDYFNAPVDENRLSRFLEQLKGLQVRTPVATSESARERFRVSEAAHERELTLRKGDEVLARLYLGKSPDMGLSYARRADQDAVHAVSLMANQVPLEAEDWLDPRLLQFEKDRLAAIKLGELELQRPSSAPDKAGDGKSGKKAEWQMKAGLPEDRVVDEAGVKNLVRRLANLRVQAILGREAKPVWGLDQPVLSLQLTLEPDSTRRYQLGQLKKEDGEGVKGYSLKVSGRPEIFRLSRHGGEQLINAAKPDALLKKAPEQEAEAGPESP